MSEKRLRELEREIEVHSRAFIALGRCLEEIRDNRLYLTRKCRSFRSYLHHRWDMSLQTGKRYIMGWKVCKVLRDAGCETMPSSLGQCETLNAVDDRVKASLWNEAVAKESSPGVKRGRVLRQIAEESGLIERTLNGNIRRPKPSVAIDRTVSTVRECLKLGNYDAAIDAILRLKSQGIQDRRTIKIVG